MTDERDMIKNDAIMNDDCELELDDLNDVSGGSWGPYERYMYKSLEIASEMVNTIRYRYKCINCQAVFGEPGDKPPTLEVALDHVRTCLGVDPDMPIFHF